MAIRSTSARRPWRRALLVAALSVAAVSPLQAQSIVPAAFVHTEIIGDYSDHSMDGMAYLVAIPLGALAGSVVGLVVGATGR